MLKFNPNNVYNCLLAYAYTKYKPEETIEEDINADAYADNDEVEKILEALNHEDGSMPEALTVLLSPSAEARLPLAEGIALTEYNPSEENGKKFWEELMKSTSLKEKAEQEGVAFGKWDILRQVINMGTIAYMTKWNAIALIINRQGFNQFVKTCVEEMFGPDYVAIAQEYAERKNADEKAD